MRRERRGKGKDMQGKETERQWIKKESGEDEKRTRVVLIDAGVLFDEVK